MLAGLPRPPPPSIRHQPEAGQVRQMYVLRRMHELKFISDAQFREAQTAPLASAGLRSTMPTHAEYVAEMAARSSSRPTGGRLHEGADGRNDDPRADQEAPTRRCGEACSTMTTPRLPGPEAYVSCRRMRPSRKRRWKRSSRRPPTATGCSWPSCSSRAGRRQGGPRRRRDDHCRREGLRFAGRALGDKASPPSGSGAEP